MLADASFQRGFRREFHRAKSRRVHDNADAHARLRERDHPEPAVESAHHADEGAVDSFWAIDIFVMREDRKFLEMIVGLFEIVKIAKHGLAPAAIEQVPGFDRFVRTGRSFDVDLHAVGRDRDSFYFGFLTNFSAVLARVIKEELVEIGASHLISAVAVGLEAVLKIKSYAFRSTRRHNLAAVFRQKGAVKFFADAKAVERLHAEWQQRFADMKARKFLALENDHAPARAREQGRGGAPGRSAADDSDIVNRFRHAAINLASLRRKQTPEARQRQTAKGLRQPDAPDCSITHHWLEMVAVDPSIFVRLIVNFSA